MYNKVIVIGNLTKDPEVRYTPQGTSVANFSLAVNRRYRSGDENREEVSYFDIVVFGKQAETCGQYLNKGSMVLVDGRLQQRRWEGDDGKKRSKVEIVGENIRFMPKRSPGGDDSRNNDYIPPDEITENDVPF